MIQLTNLEWLLSGDLVIKRLVCKYLLNTHAQQENDGIIIEYLKRYNPDQKTWGNGYYGPKWISTHYTLFDLKYFEIDQDSAIYKESLMNYVDRFFENERKLKRQDTIDLCISGMQLNMMSYGRIQDSRIQEILDDILTHKMPDGGWNCQWFHTPKPKISSVHTTINVLEGLSEYIHQGYSDRKKEVNDAIDSGVAVLLSRHLYFVKGKEDAIHPSMAEHHFPPRWKYDYLRILEFLAKLDFPHQQEMDKALDHLEGNLKEGKLTRGKKIPGLIHFPLELTTYGRFNTLRAYIVLKKYRPSVYESCIKSEMQL